MGFLACKFRWQRGLYTWILTLKPRLHARLSRPGCSNLLKLGQDCSLANVMTDKLCCPAAQKLDWVTSEMFCNIVSQKSKYCQLLFDRRRLSLSDWKHWIFSSEVDKTLQRTACREEIFEVQSLGQSSTGKWLYFCRHPIFLARKFLCQKPARFVHPFR